MTKEDEMIIITQVSRETGINLSTLRSWCQRGLIAGAVRKVTTSGKLAWHMTIEAAEARRDDPPPRGNPNLRA